jgi:hypothetical protein
LSPMPWRARRGIAHDVHGPARDGRHVESRYPSVPIDD